MYVNTLSFSILNFRKFLLPSRKHSPDRNRLQNFRKSIGNFIFWACKKRPYIVPRKQNKIPDRFSRTFFFEIDSWEMFSAGEQNFSGISKKISTIPYFLDSSVGSTSTGHWRRGTIWNKRRRFGLPLWNRRQRCRRCYPRKLPTLSKWNKIGKRASATIGCTKW